MLALDSKKEDRARKVSTQVASAVQPQQLFHSEPQGKWIWVSIGSGLADTGHNIQIPAH